MADVFTKRFADISFGDVEALVRDKVTESAILDYKESWNNNDDIANLVSAMANTYGGIVIFGVREKDGTNEPEAIVGITDEDLSNRLDSICFDNIEPPVICQSGYVPNPNGPERVFIVKVLPSDITPHAVDDGTTVYVKVQGQKRKTTKVEFEQAKIGYVRWLESRRYKHEQFRESIVESAGQRALTLNAYPNAYETETFVVPLYPRTELMDYHNLLAFLQDFRFPIKGARFIQSLSVGNRIPIPDGLCFLRKDSDGGSCSQVTAHGLYHNRVAVVGVESGVRVIYIDSVLRNIVSNLHLGVSLLRQVEYYGMIRCGFSVKKICDVTTKVVSNELGFQWRFLTEHKCRITDGSSWLREIPASTRAEGVEEVAIDLIERVLFLFDVGVDRPFSAKTLYESVCSSL